MPTVKQWFCAKCKSANDASRGRCGECGVVKPADAKLVSVPVQSLALPDDTDRPYRPGGSYGFLRLLAGIYAFAGVLLLVGAAFVVVNALGQRESTQGAALLIAAVLFGVQALICFGLGQAAQVLLVIEERTRD